MPILSGLARRRRAELAILRHPPEAMTATGSLPPIRIVSLFLPYLGRPHAETSP